MNILLNARWGYTGDLGSFPFDGINILELTVKKEDEKLNFVFFTFIHDENMVDLSFRDRSAFDEFLYGIKISFGKESYWFEYDKLVNGWPIKDSMFSAVNLGLHMLKKAEELYYSFEGRHSPMEYDGAHTFVKDWIYKDLDECDIPLFTSVEKADDGWDKEDIPF